VNQRWSTSSESQPISQNSIRSTLSSSYLRCIPPSQSILDCTAWLFFLFAPSLYSGLDQSNSFFVSSIAHLTLLVSNYRFIACHYFYLQNAIARTICRCDATSNQSEHISGRLNWIASGSERHLLIINLHFVKLYFTTMTIVGFATAVFSNRLSQSNCINSCNLFIYLALHASRDKTLRMLCLCI